MDEHLLIETSTTGDIKISADVEQAGLTTERDSEEQQQPPQIEDGHDNKDAHKQLIVQCLDRLLRVHLADGRIIQGSLDCYDHLGNIILSGASDITPRATRRTPIRMGTVLVPGHVSRLIERLSEKTKRKGVQDRMNNEINEIGQDLDINARISTAHAPDDIHQSSLLS